MKKTLTIKNGQYTVVFYGKSDSPVSPESAAERLKLLYPGICLLQQVHGNQVAVNASGSESPVADAFILSSGSGAIRTADCLPIAILSRGIFAGIHAGWRGLVAGVIEATISKMPADATAIIGPAISAKSFEIRDDVADLIPIGFVHRTREGTLYGNLPGWAREQLIQSGISPERILLLDEDTFASDLWYSHRAGDVQRNFMVVTDSAV